MNNEILEATGTIVDALEANVLRSAAMIAKRYAERARAAGKEEAAKVALQIANLIAPDYEVYLANLRKEQEIWEEGNQRIGADHVDSGVRPGWVDAVGNYHPQPSNDDDLPLALPVKKEEKDNG